MIIYVLTGLSSFIFIFLRAFQQRNVAFDRYAAVMPVSLLMAFAEVFVIANIAHRGFDLILVLTIGVGSGAGALCAMRLHKRIFSK